MTSLVVLASALGLVAARRVDSTARGPSARYAHQMMAYDEDGGRVLLFGGAGADGSLGDFWALDARGWTRLPDGPPARDSGALVYDSRRKVAVLFGGRGGEHEGHDTWEFDGRQWRHAADEGPTPGVHTAGAFDRVRGVVVLFVPKLAVGTLPRPFPSETWLWDGTRWTKASGTTPEDCLAMGMTVDRGTGRVMLLTGRFGPSEHGIPLAGADLWSWTGAGWERAPGSPPITGEPFLVNIAPAGPRGGLLLFNGGVPDGQPGITWRWDGTAWTAVGRSGPTSRNVHVMTYDARRDRVVLFGGSRQRERLGDTWEWDGARWTARR